MERTFLAEVGQVDQECPDIASNGNWPSLSGTLRKTEIGVAAREWQAAIASKRKMLQYGSQKKSIVASSDGEASETTPLTIQCMTNATDANADAGTVVELVVPGQTYHFFRVTGHIYPEMCTDGDIVEVLAPAKKTMLQDVQLPPVHVKWPSGFTNFVHFEDLRQMQSESNTHVLEMMQMQHALKQKEAEMLKLQIEMMSLKQNLAQSQNTQFTTPATTKKGKTQDHSKDIASPLANTIEGVFPPHAKQMPGTRGQPFSVENVEQDCISHKKGDKTHSSMSSMPLHQVIDTMHDNPASFEVWLVGCVLLVEAVESSMRVTSIGAQPDREVLSKIVNVGGVACASKFVRTHLASEEAVAMGLRLLSLLAIAVANAEHLVVDLGCGALVAEALRAHEASAEVQAMGCLTVGALAAGDPKVAGSLMRQGVGEVVLQALRSERRSKDSSHNACQALGLLAVWEEDAKTIVELGGIDAIFSAMRHRSRCSRVQDRAVFALHRLAVGVEQITQIISDEGIRLLEHAMRENVSLVPLQVRACQLFAVGAREVGGAADKIVDLGGAAAVQAAAQVHSTSQITREACQQALQSIALALSMEEEEKASNHDTLQFFDAIDDINVFFPPPGLAPAECSGSKLSLVQPSFLDDSLTFRALPHLQNGPIEATAMAHDEVHFFADAVAELDEGEADAGATVAQLSSSNGWGEDIAIALRDMPVEAIIELIEAHEDSLEVLAAGCQHFIKTLEATFHSTPGGILQVDASTASKLGSVGVVACAIFLAKGHITNQAAVAMAFHLLSLLAAGMANPTYLVHDLRCGELVAQAMCLHYDSGQVQSRGCGVIGALSAKSNESSCALAQAGCAGAVVAAICGRHSKECSHNGSQALFSLSSDELASSTLVRMGGIKAAFVAMRDHPKDSSVQGWSVMALFKLTSGPEALAQIITPQGVKLLAGAMSVRGAIPQLLVCGCKLLGAGARVLEGGAAIVVDSGGLEAVTWATSAHASSKPVHNAGRHALYCITMAYQWQSPLSGMALGNMPQQTWRANRQHLAGAAQSSSGTSAGGKTQSPSKAGSSRDPQQHDSRFHGSEMFDHHFGVLPQPWQQQKGQGSSDVPGFVPPPGLNVNATPFQPGNLAPDPLGQTSPGHSTLGKPVLSRLLPTGAPGGAPAGVSSRPAAGSGAFSTSADGWGQQGWLGAGAHAWASQRQANGYQMAADAAGDSYESKPQLAGQWTAYGGGARSPGPAESESVGHDHDPYWPEAQSAKPGGLVGDRAEKASISQSDVRSSSGTGSNDAAVRVATGVNRGETGPWLRDAEHLGTGLASSSRFSDSRALLQGMSQESDPMWPDLSSKQVSLMEGSDSEDLDEFDAAMSECDSLNTKKTPSRPTRGKRNRYRCLVTNLMRQVDADPVNFALEDSRLPPSIASNEFMKTKLEAKMALYVANRFAELESLGQSPLAPGAAAEKALLAERAMEDVMAGQAMLKMAAGSDQLWDSSDVFPSCSVDMALFAERRATQGDGDV